MMVKLKCVYLVKLPSKAHIEKYLAIYYRHL